MDLRALEYTRAHYDAHSNQFASTQDALRARAQGPGAPLKKFHNDIKRHLINRFASGAATLLDLACGRGGDISKWIDAGIRYVKGVDLSPGEIAEARKRFEEARNKRGDPHLLYEFVDSPQLGISEWSGGRQYDVVTCMFAIHYFFVSEQALQQFMHNVSINLREGGYFIGTVPDGKRINACIARSKTYESPMLHIEAKWQGEPKCFGSPYICAIGDTVTGGEKGTVGSFEYLVYSNVLVAVAAQHGLQPVLQYGDPRLEQMFEPADSVKALKHFRPRFPGSDPSLERASGLFAAFVFQKRGGGSAAAKQQQQQQQQPKPQQAVPPQQQQQQQQLKPQQAVPTQQQQQRLQQGAPVQKQQPSGDAQTAAAAAAAAATKVAGVKRSREAENGADEEPQQQAGASEVQEEAQQPEQPHKRAALDSSKPELAAAGGDAEQQQDEAGS